MPLRPLLPPRSLCLSCQWRLLPARSPLRLLSTRTRLTSLPRACVPARGLASIAMVSAAPLPMPPSLRPD